MFKLFIGGQWVVTAEKRSVYSPFDRSLVGEVSWGTGADARSAIDAAEQATASPVPAYRRAEILEEVASRLRNAKAEFARTIALEAGKPITAAEIEVDRAVQTLLFSATAARTLAGEVVDLGAHPAGEDRMAIVLRVPIGIVAAIAPFNFPLNLVLHKIGPAFAAGCASVLKPADKTPLSALLLAKLFQEAGLPPGWLNVIVGNAPEIAGVFLSDDRVAVISFTGSAEIGWMLREKAPKKKVLLELGNATPLIVLADADLDAAAAAVAAHGYGFSGQSCISIQRVYADAAICQRLIDKLLPKISQLKTGDPLDPSTQVGPLITEASRDRVLRWIRDAQAQGATLLAGGSIDGTGILLPTLLTNVSPEMNVSCKEIFGPVVSITPVSGLNEGIALANGTRYGLQAALFTNDLSAALIAAKRLEFGAVTVNESPTFRADHMPYGGTKDSGNTREGPRYAIEEYTERRTIVLKMPPS
ncbi:MAG TPA: aldehyde dehydrogenase family protein [Bryobacteraceae bacterium]|nr:aldehyde dehydrogenase family protein [Bryobacteraceae bacterium]